MKTVRFSSGLLLFAVASWAQQYVISTIAGGARPPTPVAGVTASISYTYGATVDASGNVFFTEPDCVFKLDQNGVLTLVAGNSRVGYSGDGGPATSAQLNNPYGVAVDGAGNLYIADTGNARIRRVSPGGIITTVAGNGTVGYSGDGGPATIAQLNFSYRLLTDGSGQQVESGVNGVDGLGNFGVAVDGTGNLYIADTGNARIRRVSPDGIITTVAGNGTAGYSGDGGPATMAQLSGLYGVAVDGAGNLYIADTGNARIRRVSAVGVITTIAGNGTVGYSGDGGSATNAQLNSPNAVAADAAGNLYIADSNNFRIRKVSVGGSITTVAGSGSSGYSGDGGLATSAQLNSPNAVAVDAAGNFYIAEARIRKVSAGGVITTVAGNGTAGGYSGDGGPATSAQLNNPYGVAVDGAGNFFIADGSGVRKVSTNGVITSVAGLQSTGTVLPPQPVGVATDGAGNLFISDLNYSKVLKVSSSGLVTTVAGNGTFGYSGDGGPATSAALKAPTGIALDSGGNLFIADSNNSRIRKVSASGIITTVAGNGTYGFSGDGGPAINAEFSYPQSVAVDSTGNIFISDVNNGVIRKVDTNGIITSLPTRLSAPYGVVVDGSGNLFIADRDSHSVRRISASGIITVIAGNFASGYSGDGGLASSAELLGPQGVAVDAAGQVYVADTGIFYTGTKAIRLLKPTNQSVLISAVLDAASESAAPISPGKIVVIYGAGLGPTQLVQNQPSNGAFGTQVGGTTVSFNGVPAPMIYASATQVAAIAPYEISGSPTAQVTVSYQGQVSSALTVPVASSAPSLFSLNETGAGQAAAVNVDGSINNASHPVKIGGYVSLFATGEGQTSPAGVDGKLATTQPYPQPLLPVSVTVGGLPATFTYAGAAPTEVAGLMQVVVQIPLGVQPGGYVPVVLQVGNASTVNGAVWISVSSN